VILIVLLGKKSIILQLSTKAGGQNFLADDV